MVPIGAETRLYQDFGVLQSRTLENNPQTVFRGLVRESAPDIRQRIRWENFGIGTVSLCKPRAAVTKYPGRYLINCCSRAISQSNPLPGAPDAAISGYLSSLCFCRWLGVFRLGIRGQFTVWNQLGARTILGTLVVP